MKEAKNNLKEWNLFYASSVLLQTSTESVIQETDFNHWLKNI